MDELELELKTTFLAQAQQLVSEAEQSFMDLEAAPGDVAILDRIFRIMHNMKGSANGVGFTEIGEFTHTFESLLLKLKNGDIKANLPMVNLLLECNDAVTDMANKLRENMDAKFNYGDLRQVIESAIKTGGYPDPVQTTEPVKTISKIEPAKEASTKSQTAQPALAMQPSTSPNWAGSAEHAAHARNGEPTKYKITPGERFLCFNLGDQEYAIPLLSVKEVIGIPSFTPIPQSPAYFLGITNLRGTVIPVLDLPRKLSIVSKTSSEKAVIILDVGTNNLGIAVDSVNNVIAPQEKDLSPRPETDPNVRTDYIIGIYRREKQMVLFVDVAKALGTDDWAAINTGTSETTNTEDSNQSDSVQAA